MNIILAPMCSPLFYIDLNLRLPHSAASDVKKHRGGTNPCGVLSTNINVKSGLSNVFCNQPC